MSSSSIAYAEAQCALWAVLALPSPVKVRGSSRYLPNDRAFQDCPGLRRIRERTSGSGSNRTSLHDSISLPRDERKRSLPDPPLFREVLSWASSSSKRFWTKLEREPSCP